MVNRLLVFPQGRQLSYLLSKNTGKSVIYVVFQGEPENIRGVIPIRKDINREEVRELLPENMLVLCCHEEALYWVKKNGLDGWRYSFDKIILEQLTKPSFKSYLQKNNIKTAPFSSQLEGDMRYPIVLKPAIGFGSIGVKKISNIDEYLDYKENYSSLIENSNIKKYAEKYFEGEDNLLISEEYISGDFYRIPFIVIEGTVRYVFPIKGIEITLRDNSDYHWTGFEYLGEDNETASRIAKALQRITEIYAAKNGSYVAEIIVADDGEYILEFSPRQTSSRLSKLVYLATGIDLELMAVDLFMKNETCCVVRSKNVKMLIKAREDQYVVPGYRMIEDEQEVSVYDDTIAVCYYEKEE